MARPAPTPTTVQLQLGKAQVSAQVRKGRAGRVRLSIANGVLQIETPSGGLNEAEGLLQQKARWIARHLTQQGQAQGQAAAYKASLATEVHILGKVRRVVLEAGPATRYRLLPDAFVITAPQRYLSHPVALVRLALRRLAEQYLVRRTRELAAITGDAVQAVRVKPHRSKWGSCSTLRNINLNWHLLLLDKAVVDYVIIHELMHLREMNHGPRFWAHVAHYYPNYKQAVQQLKLEQWKIGIYD